MMKLPMASSSTRQFPAIIFNFLNHISYFQNRAFLKCSQYHFNLASYICGVGLGVAVAEGVTCGGVLTGVALGAIAGVAFTFGVGCGVASCIGVPDDEGDPAVTGVADAFGVTAAVGVGLGFGCMFIAFLSTSFPSGPNTIWIPLFWLSLATSCGTATAYIQVDPTNLSPCLVTSHRV